MGSAGFDWNRRTSIEIRRLLGRSLRHWENGYIRAAFGFGIEFHATIDESEKRVILASADILAGMPLGAALACKDVAGNHRLPAEKLNAKAPTRCVAAVTR